MNSSFANVITNRFDRMFGGTNKGTADPYITGYHFICWYQLPSLLSSMVSLTPPGGGVNGKSAPLGLSQIQNLLAGSNLSVTPPGHTINRTEFQALGGLKYTSPTSIDLNNSISIRYLEYSGKPVSNIHHNWAKIMRQYRTGTSALIGDDLTKSGYAGTLLYWTTKPDGLTVEFYGCYTGVYPTRDPQDLFSDDIASVDKLEIDMEYALDWAYHEPWVKVMCESLASQYKQEGMRVHGSSDNGGNQIGIWEQPGS